MNWLMDTRTQCFSVQTTIDIGQYLELVKVAHSSRGGLSGQRETLKTTTGKRIRNRMIDDIRAGAVLPPVVIGLVVEKSKFDTYPDHSAQATLDLVPQPEWAQIAIIDGMQRTSALMEAAAIDATVNSRSMRIEFWLASSVRMMVYRMLVLNTGQVPWTLSRQLSVVFEPLLKEMSRKVPNINRIFTPDQPGRRITGGEYASDALVELYLSFSLRKTTIDTKEALSDEFSRLDFVENVSDSSFQDQFYITMGLLTAFDKAFSRYDPQQSDQNRFSKGKHIFGGQPARIGFIVAISQFVLGRPGLDREHDDRNSRMDQVDCWSRKLIRQLHDMNEEELKIFLKLDVLSETLNKRVGQVGRYERQVFFDGFQVLISEKFDLPNMEPCWRAN